MLHSQASQDVFVQMVLGYPGTGFYLEVGAGHPVELSNTYALEKAGWSGLSVDTVDQGWRNHRKNPFAVTDACTYDFKQALNDIRAPRVIDYLSLDVDESSTLALKQVLKSGRQFRVITIEHDAYRFGDKLRSEQRKILEKACYERVCSDVNGPEWPFEDWYLMPWGDYPALPRWSNIQHDEIIRQFSKIIAGGNLNGPFFPGGISSYFDKIFCINLNRRPERWEDCVREIDKFGLSNVERFPAIDGITLPFPPLYQGNAGCVASHRAILDLIVKNGWNRTLILEDDFKIVRDDFHALFAHLIQFVPDDWDMLYLGGHYACPPRCRINQHLIRHAGMKTTSSYGITREFAAKVAPHITGSGPIDDLYCGHHAGNNCYIFQPRMITQREGYSDLSYQPINNEPSMLDESHENMV